MILPGGKVISTKLAAGIGGGVVAAAGVATAVILTINGQNSFRSITVLDTVGQVTVTREAEQMEPYKDMKLESGDDVLVGEASELDMLLDGDKTVYVEENTHMWLEAAGTPEDSETVIYMDAGATMHKIDNKLSDASVYQVDTPNSTMSIRGTIPRVVVDYRDGIYYTDYQVFEGVVSIQLKTTEGELVGEPVEVGAGYQVKTRGDMTFSEIILQKVDGKDAEIVPIDYRELPLDVLEHLEEIVVEEGRVLAIGDKVLALEELKQIIEEKKEEAEDEGSEEPEATPEPTPEPTPELTPTPEVTPVPKVLAEPVATAEEGIITPEVSPSITPTATAAAEEEVTPTPTPEPTPEESTYTVNYMSGGSVFATKTVTGTNPGSAPTFQPSEAGSWGSPVVDETNKTITINWN